MLLKWLRFLSAAEMVSLYRNKEQQVQLNVVQRSEPTKSWGTGDIVFCSAEADSLRGSVCGGREGAGHVGNGVERGE